MLAGATNAVPGTLLTCSVWCWGWDGAGDLDGPDVDPIWEKMPFKSYQQEAIEVKHDRSLPNYPHKPTKREA